MVDIRAMTVAGVVRAIGQGGTLAGVVIGPIAAVLALLDDRPTAAFFHLVGGAFCLGVLAYTMLVTRIVGQRRTGRWPPIRTAHARQAADGWHLGSVAR